MLEESIPAIWASLYSWFTPTVLFVLINIVIGTIAFSSHNKEEKPQNGLTRTASVLERTGSVLERLKSINLYRQKTIEIPSTTAFYENPEFQTAHHTREVVEEVKEDDYHKKRAVEERRQFEEPAVEECHVEKPAEEEHNVKRSASDTRPTAGEKPVMLAQKKKKSASAKSAFAHFKMEETVKRPATVRETTQTVKDDDEVDAKADDFINKFKQQLKLQRLDSIMRYKEMLNRGK